MAQIQPSLDPVFEHLLLSLGEHLETAKFLNQVENKQLKDDLVLAMALQSHKLSTSLLPNLSFLLKNKGDAVCAIHTALQQRAGLRYAVATSALLGVEDPRQWKSRIKFTGTHEVEGQEPVPGISKCRSDFARYVVANVLDSCLDVTSKVKSKMIPFIAQELRTFKDRIKKAFVGKRASSKGRTIDGLWRSHWNKNMNSFMAKNSRQTRSAWTEREKGDEYANLIRKIVPFVLSEPAGYYTPGVDTCTDKQLVVKYYSFIRSILSKEEKTFMNRCSAGGSSILKYYSQNLPSQEIKLETKSLQKTPLLNYYSPTKSGRLRNVPMNPSTISPLRQPSASQKKNADDRASISQRLLTDLKPSTKSPLSRNSASQKENANDKASISQRLLQINEQKKRKKNIVTEPLVSTLQMGKRKRNEQSTPDKDQTAFNFPAKKQRNKLSTSQPTQKQRSTTPKQKKKTRVPGTASSKKKKNNTQQQNGLPKFFKALYPS